MKFLMHRPRDLGAIYLTHCILRLPTDFPLLCLSINLICFWYMYLNLSIYICLFANKFNLFANKNQLFKKSHPCLLL